MCTRSRLSIVSPLFVCLYLFFDCHFQVPYFSSKVFPKIPCTPDYNWYGPVQQMVHTYKSLIPTAKCIHPLQYGVTKPYHSLYTELCLMSLKKCLLSKPILWKQQRLILVNRMCLCGTDCSALLTSFPHITSLHLYKPGLPKLCACVNGFFLHNKVLIWSL
jgi:hypothetical protein